MSLAFQACRHVHRGAYRRLSVSTFLTTAIATLAITIPGLGAAYAQSVTGSGVTPVPDGSSDWSVGGSLSIGSTSPGGATLMIQDGGKVSNTTGTIANGSGRAGTVTVSGRDINGDASTWTNSSALFIGLSGGTGTLIIDRGGVVSDSETQIGRSSTANVGVGTVTVSGAGSTLMNANNLTVGMDRGNGTLSVTDGGAVHSMQGDIGYDTSGTGANGTVGMVTVSGDGSVWTNSSIFLGRGGGSGTLTIEDGGVVSTTSFVRMGDVGASIATLHLNGDASARGVLETSSVNKLTGTVTLDLNGGILRATQNQANFLNGFSTLTLGSGGAWFDTNGFDIAIGTAFDGAAGVNKLGSGTLTLTGNSTYTGGTTINGGTVRISDDSNLGAAAGGLSFDGGTLNTTANIISSRSVTLDGTGTFLTDTGTTLKLTGDVSGSGTLVKDGSGALVLSGDAAQTGGTTISGGTLQIGDGGTTGSVTGNVANNGALVFDRSDDLVFDGLVSGTGSLTMNGTGTLTLTGAAPTTARRPSIPGECWSTATNRQRQGCLPSAVEPRSVAAGSSEAMSMWLAAVFLRQATAPAR